MTIRRNKEPRKILSHYTDANGNLITKDEYTKLFTGWMQRDKELQKEKIDRIKQIEKLKGKLAKLKDTYEIELSFDEMNISDIDKYPNDLKSDIEEIENNIQYLFAAKKKPTCKSIAVIIESQWITREKEIKDKLLKVTRLNKIDQKGYFNLMANEIPKIKEFYTGEQLYKAISK